MIDGYSHQSAALVYRIGRLGDTLTALPAIAAVREKFPGHRLILLTDRQPTQYGYVSSWDVLGATGWFDQVMYYDPSATGVNWLRQKLALVRQLRTKKLEYVFYLAPARTWQQTWRDYLFFRWLVGTRRLWFDRAHSATYFERRPPLQRREFEWLRLLRIVDSNLITVQSRKFQLSIPDSERRSVEAVLAAAGVSANARIVAFGPGSKMQSKRWPAERFIEVGRLLLNTFPNLYIVTLGGPEDRNMCELLCNSWGCRSTNLAGHVSIYGSASVLQKCCAYFGNDSGTMHLAAMVGIRCVAIFSARDYPGVWEPYGEGHISLRDDPACAGCMLETCIAERNRCLTSISTEKAYAALLQLIAN